MSTPTDAELQQAFSESHDLAPSFTSWGLYAYSDAPPVMCGSGTGSFLWFGGETEMLRFVREYLAWWHPAPSSMTAEEIAEGVQRIVDESAGKLREGLNDFMRNMWQIEWWGTFKDLCESEEDFPTSVRESFQGGDDSAFVEYLKEYGA